MKTKLLLLVSIIVLGSCSAPKYTYKFDYHDYNAGRKERQAIKEVAANPGPVEIQPEMLVAEGPVVTPEAGASVSAPSSKPAPLTVTKAEKKGMIKDLKQAMKKVAALKKSGDIVQTDQSTKAMDADLKMSLIFLVIAIATGVVGTFVLPELFYILGAVAIIIAIVYLVRWIMRQ
jgi:hypothetical protein